MVTVPTGAYMTPLLGTTNASKPVALSLAPPSPALNSNSLQVFHEGSSLVLIKTPKSTKGSGYTLTCLPSLLTAVVALTLCLPLLAKDFFANLTKIMNSPQKNTCSHNKMSASFILLEVCECYV